jgi:hypothetical protein
MTIRDTETLRGLLGFTHNEVDGAAPRVYASDSFAVLKDKVLELGAHRIDGQEGTGRDLREVIQKIDTPQLAETIVALGGAVDLRTHTSRGYDDGIPLGERAAIETVYRLRDESVSLDGFVDQTLDLLKERGYSYDNGYSDDVMDGLYRGTMNIVETSEGRIAALDLGYNLQDAETFEKEAHERFQAGWFTRRLNTVSLAPGAGYPIPIVESDETAPKPVRQLIAEMDRLLNELYEDYPATAEEIAEAARELAEAGDSDGYRELLNLVQAEHDNPSDRETIKAVDRFLLDHQAKWIGGTPADAIVEEPAREAYELEPDRNGGFDFVPRLDTPRGRERLSRLVNEAYDRDLELLVEPGAGDSKTDPTVIWLQARRRA